MASNIAPKVLIIDVDGVMTDGSFHYTSEGKSVKVFSADDHDALALIGRHLEVRFVTGDRRGFPISAKRIAEDMKCRLDLVSTVQRVEWIGERYSLDEVAYIGDGIFDSQVFLRVGYAIAVANALPVTRRYARYVTERRGGDRAVADAVLHLLERFFEPFDPAAELRADVAYSGQWTADAAGAVGAEVGNPAVLPPVDPAAAATAYFTAFNAQNLAWLEIAFSPEASLTDWDNAVVGRPAVLAFNAELFAALPSLRVEVNALHRAGRVVVAELTVAADGVAPFTVTDVIEFDDAGRIGALRAYRGKALPV